ncbi:MAG: hypothetical protein JWM08_1133 [Candidatus Angelobacter sp.]|nr:hypothetical protein [Candidatus Angelobacter sp.]HEV7519782.1 hypothetical protein [Candidatus Angelobacter sp.]
MNCQQFQETLPYIIESGGGGEDDSHLQECTSCASLVQDLRYIAEQAKLLLPMHDPNPRVWSNIEQSLQREGLLPEGRMPPLGHIKKNSTSQTQAKSWTPLGWALALTAVIVFTVVLTNYKPSQLPQTPLTAQNSAADPAQFNSDDRQLISRLSQQAPDAQGAYESSLRDVNAYIADAEQAAKTDPGDATAQALLQDAYQQKEMLYQMATARSLP